MATISTAARNALPASKFALPQARKFPIPDKIHAVNAKARATQGVARGTLSAAAAARIRTKANAMLKGK